MNIYKVFYNFAHTFQIEPSPVNRHRKMVVCDVLPVVLARISDPQQKNLYRWIQKSIDFCINYITQPHLLHANSATDGADGSGVDGVEVLDNGVMGFGSTTPTDPWATLFDIIDAAGTELGKGLCTLVWMSLFARSLVRLPLHPFTCFARSAALHSITFELVGKCGF